MTTPYQQDVIAWANEQAALLRAGRFAEINLEQIAEEIEDVGKSEQRELANRMALYAARIPSLTDFLQNKVGKIESFPRMIFDDSHHDPQIQLAIFMHQDITEAHHCLKRRHHLHADQTAPLQ